MNNMVGTLTKKGFIDKYGYNSYKDMNDFIVDNLTILKYQRKISGYKISSSKNYAIIYLPYNRSKKEQRYVNINLIKLYNLLRNDFNIFSHYIENNYKIKEMV